MSRSRVNSSLVALSSFSGFQAVGWERNVFHRTKELIGLVALAFLFTLVGCGTAKIESTYGKRRGSDGQPSVNGTAVLAKMFEEAGSRVSTWRRMSPKLEECQTIVWFPDDFAPPTLDQRDFLEWWLYNEPNRTAVYVGRDFDATPAYWSQVLPIAPAEQRMEVMRRKAEMQAMHEAARNRMPNEEKAEWFTIKRDEPYRKIDDLVGPWATDVDTTKTDIELAGRLALPSNPEIDEWVEREDNYWEDRPTFTPLLQSGDDVIAFEITYPEWDNSKLIVINNGSFLLNFPLVNHEHRKLAGKLISVCDEGRVVFLESGAGGPEIFDVEPGTDIPTGFEVFTVWPLGFIVIHLTALGILCCIAIFPIFGRPKGSADNLDEAASLVIDSANATHGSHTPSKSDFGDHIDALGELLEKTEDRKYARDRVSYYHEHVARDSGTSHRAAK